MSDKSLMQDFLVKASSYRQKDDELNETVYLEAAADLLPLVERVQEERKETK